MDPWTGEPDRPDSVCRSEHWATIGRVVKDIDIFFISDIDPGESAFDAGSWQLNPVHYLQLSGNGTAPGSSITSACPSTANVQRLLAPSAGSLVRFVIAPFDAPIPGRGI